MIWEIVFLLVILKIPLVWVCWVVWWSIKAEPEVDADGNQDMSWRPWHRSPGSRPSRGGPHGRGGRKAARSARAARDRADA